MLGCDHWGPVGSPESKMVRFSNLVGVVIGPLSKKLAVKRINEISFLLGNNDIVKALERLLGWI